MGSATTIDLTLSPGLVSRLAEGLRANPGFSPAGTSLAATLSRMAAEDGHRSQWGAVWQAFTDAATTAPSLFSGPSLDIALEAMLRTALRTDGFTKTDSRLALDSACRLLSLADSPAAASRCLATWVASRQGDASGALAILALGASPGQACCPGRTVFQRAVERLWVTNDTAAQWVAAGADWTSTTARGQTLLHLILEAPGGSDRHQALLAVDARVPSSLWVVADDSGQSARAVLLRSPELCAALPAVHQRAEAAFARSMARQAHARLDKVLPVHRAAPVRRRM